MEKLRITIVMLLIAVASYGQTAKEVLDKAAAIVSNKSGATANFVLKGGQMNDKGTIAIKGRMFHATTPDAIIWFDGKTQWTYIKNNDEVNVVTPKASDLQLYNPSTFIYMYKNGYNYTMKKDKGSYEIHLIGSGKKDTLREMYITIDQKTFIPSKIRIRHNKGWNTIEVSNFKKANLSDGTFRFNAKDFPQAEVIDLR